MTRVQCDLVARVGSHRAKPLTWVVMFDHAQPARCLMRRCAVREVSFVQTGLIRRRQRLPGARGTGCRMGVKWVAGLSARSTGSSDAAVSGGALGLVAWGDPSATWIGRLSCERVRAQA